MKNIFISIFTIGFTLLGCQGFLEKEPLPSVSPQNFFRNADDAEAALASVYDALQNGDGGFGNDIICAGEMPSDNCTSNNSDVLDLERINWNPQTTQVRRIFAVMYTSINRANAVLKYVPGIDMAEGRKEQILGEANFLRALNYFILVQLYGGVPLRLEPIETADENMLNQTRVSSEEVYTQIISDLQRAEELVSESYGSQSADRTRVTKGAVNALQARVYLVLRDWTSAAAAANKVITGGRYLLATSFNDLFPANNHQESILEVQYSGTATDNGNSLPDLILPAPPAYYAFEKYNIPTNELIEYADTVNDLRWKYDGTGGVGLRSHVSYVDSRVPGGGNQGPFAYKWRSTPALAFNSPDNTYIIRYAEVLLSYAEAVNEESGPSMDALDKVNLIRQRAGLSALELAEVPTKKALRDEIDRQRRLEFAFEGLRWFDLVRYARHEAADASADHSVTAMDIIQEKRGNLNTNYLLFPIPQNELNVNEMEQNPGF